MANKKMFSTKRENKVVPANTVNNAGGKAYAMTDEEALCQYVVTSTFGDVYYASGKEQLDAVKKICDNVRPELIAKAAVYGHENGKMKDVPAYLLAVLAAKGEIDLLRKAFNRVIDNPKMLYNFVQIVRSGVTGRKSFGSAVKNLINNWITSRRGNRLFLASIGYSDPSFADVLKMVHTKPSNEEQNAFFGYVLGKNYNPECLPPLTKEFEAFKKDNTQPLPDMDYRALTNCNLTKDHWKEIALNMPWNTLRMNLNMLNKHGVFEDDKVLKAVTKKLADAEQVKKWNAFPYQLLTTYQNVEGLPTKIMLALQDALEHATNNVPVLGERVAVCVDVSGSMSSPVTGSSGSTTTKTKCIDVGALIASSIARTNPETTIISFGTTARVVPDFNPRDSVVTNAVKLTHEGSVCGYGTEVANAMRTIINLKKKFDFVVFVGDSQSWIDSKVGVNRLYTGTSSAVEFAKFKSTSKNAKLVEIVLGPYTNTQMPTGNKDILCVGGMSDSVFDVMKQFTLTKGETKFLNVVKEVDLG